MWEALCLKSYKMTPQLPPSFQSIRHLPCCPCPPRWQDSKGAVLSAEPCGVTGPAFSTRHKSVHLFFTPVLEIDTLTASVSQVRRLE